MQVNRWHTVLLCSTILISVSAAPASVPASGPVSSSQSNGAGAPGRDIVTWNQSQHGKYNLQVSLKDIKIIAVLNSDYYDDDDENLEYDYEDLEESSSEEPAKPTTETTEEIEDNLEMENSAGAGHEDATSSKKPPAAVQQEHEATPPVLLTFVADGKPENISQLPNDPAKRTATSRRPGLYHRDAPTTKPPPNSVECEPGFVVDRLGRCRKQRRRRPTLFPFKFSFPGFRGFRLARLAPQHQASGPSDV